MVGESRGEGGVSQACGQSERGKESLARNDGERGIDRGQKRSAAEAGP